MGLKVYRLWAMGQLDTTCRAPPWARASPRSRRAAAGDGGGGALKANALVAVARWLASTRLHSAVA
jgi:hypothetical protein